MFVLRLLNPKKTEAIATAVVVRNTKGVWIIAPEEIVRLEQLVRVQLEARRRIPSLPSRVSSLKRGSRIPVRSKALR